MRTYHWGIGQLNEIFGKANIMEKMLDRYLQRSMAKSQLIADCDINKEVLSWAKLDSKNVQEKKR